MAPLNYRHLHYFWVVAKSGGVARAAEHLGMAVQTISAQLRELERSVGRQLLKPSGRGVELTEAGRIAYRRADEIFRTGQLLQEELQDTQTGQALRLRVGLSDGLSKLAAHALMAPALAHPDIRLVCHDGELDQLLAELALHHLDLVLAGQPPARHAGLRVVSDRVARAPVLWYGPASLVRKGLKDGFPASLAEVPVLLPTAHAPLRHAVDHWLDSRGLRLRVVGEFEDSALLAVFAARGMGVFPVSSLGANDVDMVRGLRFMGASDDLVEEIHAIRTSRGQQHPAVQAILQAAPGR